MNETVYIRPVGPDGNPLKGMAFLRAIAKKFPELPTDTAGTTQMAVSDAIENLSSPGEKNTSGTDEKNDTPETIFSVSESIKNPPEDTVKSIYTPMVSPEETDVPVRRNPFPPLVQVVPTEGRDSVFPTEDSDVVNEKSDSGVTEKNEILESEKISNMEDEKNISLGHTNPSSSTSSPIVSFVSDSPSVSYDPSASDSSSIPIISDTTIPPSLTNSPVTPSIASSTSTLNNHQSLSKFEEGFAKTLPIEDFPWKSREKTLPDGDAQHETTPVNTEDEAPFSRAIRSDVSHTSGAIRRFWSKVNDDLSCLDGALSCVGGTPDDTEWVKERTKTLFESVYNAIESLREDVFEAAEMDVRDFLDSERDSYIASSETTSDIIPSEVDYSEAPVSRGEGLERWARWVGRNEDGIIVLQKAPYWTDNNESEICSTEAVRDSGVDIYLLADLLKESDIGKVRKIIREVSKMKGINFIFRHPKRMRNSTGRPLTSKQEATISGSSMGYITLEGFFDTLAYALAKSSKMNE